VLQSAFGIGSIVHHRSLL